MLPDAATMTETGEALRLCADDGVAWVIRRYHEVRPDLMRQFDDKALAQVETDVRYHFDFLTQALVNAEPAIFDNYVAWVATLFAGIGLPEEWLTESLEFVAQAGHALLEPTHARSIDALVSHAVARMADRGVDADPFLTAGGEAGRLASAYLEAQVAANRDRALAVIMDALEAGMDLETLYLQVIAPAQAEIGRLWLTGRISVATEHAATAITQTLLGALSRFRAATPRSGRTVLVACVGKELHEVGARIVADFFDMSGWDVYYLGANTPLDVIVAATAERKPDVLALSATMAPHLTDLRIVIDGVRMSGATQDTKIIVGGRPFNVAPGLWRAVGADGWGPDAGSAVRVAGSVLGG